MSICSMTCSGFAPGVAAVSSKGYKFTAKSSHTFTASEGKQLQREQSVGMGSNGRATVNVGVAVSDD